MSAEPVPPVTDNERDAQTIRKGLGMYDPAHGGHDLTAGETPIDAAHSQTCRRCAADAALARLVAALSAATTERGYILFDVDGCLLDLKGNPIPGVERLLDTVRLLGFGVRVWSAGGEQWAREAANKLGATEARCYTKPDYPPTEEDALAILGEPPALQVDDDQTERVGMWPFMHTPYVGDGLAAQLAAATTERDEALADRDGARRGEDEAWEKWQAAERRAEALAAQLQQAREALRPFILTGWWPTGAMYGKVVVTLTIAEWERARTALAAAAPAATEEP